MSALDPRENADLRDMNRDFDAFFRNQPPDDRCSVCGGTGTTGAHNYLCVACMGTGKEDERGD